MKKRVYWLGLILALLFLTCSSSAQVQNQAWRMTIKPSIGFEYFSKVMDLYSYDTEEKEWIRDEEGTRLKSYFVTLSVGFELQEGFSLTPILGYSVSNHGAILFRRLPFSIELDVGGISGLLFGAETEKRLWTFENFEIGAFGQFVYYSGNKEEWDIPDLSVEGTVEGKPYWLRGLIGPSLIYRGYEYFSPYLHLCYSWHWGKFKLDQKIKDLEKEEEKKLVAKSQINISLGATYEIAGAFHVLGEASFMPRKDGVDLGIVVRVLYMF